MKLLECLPISWIQLYEGSTHQCILVTILQYSLFFYYNARKGKYTFCWCIYILSKTEVPWDQDSSISKFYSPIVRSYKLLLVYIRLWEKCKYILSPMKSILKFQCLLIILISQMNKYWNCLFYSVFIVFFLWKDPWLPDKNQEIGGPNSLIEYLSSPD